MKNKLLKKLVSMILACILLFQTVINIQTGNVFAEFSESVFSDISAGGSFSMFLNVNGDAYLVGSNSYGQLGNGTIENKLIPTLSMSGVEKISGGFDHSVFLLQSGEVYTSGLNIFGQLGNGIVTNDNTPTSNPVLVMTGVSNIDGGVNHTLLIKQNGDVYSAGYNLGGQLGDGTQNDTGSFVFVMSGAQSVSAGEYHSMFLKTNGDLYTSGYNAFGEIGDGSNDIIINPKLVMSSISAISAGDDHSLALTTTGVLYGFGGNIKYQLGITNNSNQTLPVLIMTGVSAISGGKNHSLALDTNGDLYTMGSGDKGQLGNGATSDYIIPTYVQSSVSKISAGSEYSLIITEDGDVKGFGFNENGKLGPGHNNNVNIPTFIRNLEFDTKIPTGSDDIADNSGALTGMAYYWGFDEGTGTTAYDSYGEGNIYVSTGSTWHSSGGYLSGNIALDGSNFLRTNPIDGFPTDNISVAFLAKTSDTTNSGTFLSFASFGNNEDFLIYDQTSLKIKVEGTEIDTGISINDNNWHQIVVTWENTSGLLELYKNSIKSFTGTINASYIINNAGIISIGQNQGCSGGCFNTGNSLIGEIDDFGIYSEVLSEDDVLLLYENTTYGPYNYCDFRGVPTAQSITITGTTIEGYTITGSYNYNDADGDNQSGTYFQWQSSTVIDGAYSDLVGQTSITHILDSNDKNKYLKLNVTPVSDRYPWTGSTASSSGFWIDGTSPHSGDFTINNGSGFTASTGVTLNIICAQEPTSTGSLPISFAFGNTANPTNWSQCTGASQFNTGHVILGGSESSKEVYLRFKDASENITNDIVKSITLDQSSPIGGSVSHTNGYETDYILGVAINRGTDSVSSLSSNNSDYLLEIQTGSLNNGECSNTGAWIDAGVNEVSNSTGYTISSIDGECYRFRYTVKDVVGNTTTFTSSLLTKVTNQTARIDQCEIQEVTGSGYQIVSVGPVNTLNSNFSGSFIVNITGSASVAGIKSISFPDLGFGLDGSGDCTTDTCSQVYTWDGVFTPGVFSATVTGNNDVTIDCNFSVEDDYLSPGTGSISYVTQYLNSNTLKPVLSVDDGIDSGVGLDTSTRRLSRQTGTLSGNICYGYGSFFDVAYTGVPNTVMDNSGITGALCYKYQWSIEDKVGNLTTYSDIQGDEFKVDTNIPIVSINSITGSEEAIYYESGDKELYYRTTAGDKNIDVESYAYDPESETKNVYYPSLGNGFSQSGVVAGIPGISLYNYNYSISGSTNISTGTQGVLGENNAGLFGTGIFNVIVDNTMPNGISITCPGDYNNDGGYTVNGSYGTDDLSGVSNDKPTFQRRNGSLIGNSCISMSSYTDIGSIRDTDLSQTGLAIGCYDYRYYSEDNVTNSGVSLGCNIKVDTSNPIINSYGITENSDYMYYNTTGESLYYNNNLPLTESFTFDIDSNDPDSTIYSLSGSSAFGENPLVNTGVSMLNYSIENGSTCSGQLSTTTTNYSLLTTNESINCLLDTTSPYGGSLTYTNGYETDTGILVTINRGIDDDSGLSLDDSKYSLEYRSSLLSGNTCAGFTGAWIDSGVNEFADSTSYLVDSTGALCYSFRYNLSDNVGNLVTITGSQITRVDLTAPLLSGLQTSESSSYVYYKSSSGTLYYNNMYYSDLDILMGSADMESAIYSSSGSTEFGDSPQSNSEPYTISYSIETGSNCNGGSFDVSLTNNALLSSTGTILCQLDIIVPYSGSITYTDGYETYNTMPLQVDRGLDTLSELSIVDENYSVDYRTKILTGNTCRGNWGDWVDTNITGSVTATGYDFLSDHGKCHEFRYNVTDNVANPATWTGTDLTFVDKTLPPTAVLEITEESDFLFYSGTNLYHNTKYSDGGSFTFELESEDYETDISSVYGSKEFEDKPIDNTGSFQTGSITGTYSLVYNVETGATCDYEDLILSSKNNASRVTNISYNCYNDTLLPEASIEIYNEHVFNSNSKLILTFSDNGFGQSGVRDCRYANDGTTPDKWSEWEPCQNEIDWILSDLYGTRTVYYQVRDNVGNIKEVSNTTKLKFIDRAEYGSSNSSRSISRGSSDVSNYSYKKIDTKDSLRFKKVINGILPSEIRITHPTSNHYAEIEKQTQINFSNGKIFNGVLVPPTIVSKNTIPMLHGEIPSLRAVQMGDENGNTLYFTKPIKITLSTKGISSVVNRNEIDVYSYKDKNGKYTLEDTNRVVNISGETISVEVNHMTTYVLMYRKDIESAIAKSVIYTPFIDIDNHWGKSYIEELYKLGVLSRKLEFKPDDYLTRTELVKIVLDSFGYGINLELSEEDKESVDYADTDFDQWYISYLAEAAKQGLIDKTYKVKTDFEYIQYPYIESVENNRNIQKMFKFLGYDIQITGDYDDQTRSVIKQYQEKYNFRDISGRMGKWTSIYLNAEDNIVYAIENKGKFKKAFRPLDKVTRAEALKVILKAAGTKDYNPGTYENNYKDIIDGSWYEKYVLYGAAKGILKGYPNLTIDPGGFVTRAQMSAITSRTIENTRDE